MPASVEPRCSPSGQTTLAETPKLIQPWLRRLRAFGWTCLILLAAVGVCVLVVVLLSPTAHGLPKARLLLLTRIEQKPQEDPGGSLITFDPAAPYPAPEMWKAEFEIRVPTNRMIGLTHREIGVAVLGDNGMWTAAKPFLGDRIPDYLRLGTRGISRNGSLLVPA